VFDRGSGQPIRGNLVIKMGCALEGNGPRRNIRIDALAMARQPDATFVTKLPFRKLNSV
jgi:hypothetical protein